MTALFATAGLFVGVVNFEWDVNEFYEDFNQLVGEGKKSPEAMDTARFKSSRQFFMRWLMLGTTLCAVLSHIARHYYSVKWAA